MSAEREELRPLIQEPPEDEVPAVLDAAVPPPHRKGPGVATSLVRRRPGPDP